MRDNYSGRQKLLTFNTRASFVERVRKAGSCSNVGERAVGALVSPLDCFPVLSQVVARWVPPWYDVSRPDPTLPSLAGKPTVDSCRLSTKRRVHVSWGAGAAGSLGARKSPHFCLECRGRTCANPRWGRLPAFSRPLSRCSPLSSHPPVLRLWCADGASSARGTISVLSLHRQRRPAEQKRRQQSTLPHAAGNNSWKERASQRSRSWPGESYTWGLLSL